MFNVAFKTFSCTERLLKGPRRLFRPENIHPNIPFFMGSFAIRQVIFPFFGLLAGWQVVNN